MSTTGVTEFRTIKKKHDELLHLLNISLCNLPSLIGIMSRDMKWDTFHIFKRIVYTSTMNKNKKFLL
jgi:hypothetical protein